ncbi:MAG: CPBP family intramembrane glutamic endopeptidase [Bacteroidota bacterium]
MNRKLILQYLRNATLVVAGILLFALFIHNPWPRKIIALGALLASALLIAFTLRQDSLLQIVGIGRPSLRILLFTLAALILGIGLGILTRQHFRLSLLPATLSLVAAVAPLTGAMEELVFRGYIQGMLNPLNRFLALVYAAIAHTAYKVLVIYSLGRPEEFDFLFLAQWTLLGGLAFGFLRFLSKSIYPPVMAHVVFDILVYGGMFVAPYWIWS